ncbi:MAG: chalcone isomerase family protein [Verrucomicrobiales bacterium]
MNSKTLPLALAVSLALISPAIPLVVEGYKFPTERVVSGKELALNGSGVRSVKFGPLPIKAYVATFYTAAPLRSEKAVLASTGPFQFDFKFLKEVSQKQVTKAWKAQLEASNSHDYEGLESDKAKFVSFFGPLSKGGTETIVIDGDETRAYDNGKLKGSIKGRDFQRAFLSLWFGDKPVAPSLKKDLLGI